ncbi:Protein of unknown function (DUF2905) [Abditibacterium utsteinense]|uniref:DUF2905 domain-containing protein n=1 Tax=Abditibacterium utsteinense TaxID=1960156 RepID=A0A2S8SR28_9BACT|nr:DUF2905 domain-containing protein [Abditibacterium utsteinense]PQV63253.1 Protein of unknown function (DUF2905) [Abditibacterium utsteinense]
MPLQSFAKFLIFGGVALLLAGIVFLIVSRFFPAGMPGDLSYKRGNTAIYFPIVSSIVLSIVATIVLNIVLRFLR